MIFYFFARNHRRNTIQHLAMAFGNEKTEKEIRELSREYIETEEEVEKFSYSFLDMKQNVQNCKICKNK